LPVSMVDIYYSAAPEDRHRVLPALLAEVKRVAPTQPETAIGLLCEVVQPDLDYSSAMMCHRILTEFGREARAHTKLAILGGFMTHQLSQLIELFLFAIGIDVQIYESDYNVFNQEIADPTSGLYAFQPDFVFVAVNRRNLGHQPSCAESAARVREMVDAEVKCWSNLWQAMHERLNCQIIQNNFDSPQWRTLYNHEMRHHAGLGRFVSQVNLALQETAPSFVTIHDVDYLAATVGRWAWGDARFYYHAKLPCAPEFLVAYAHSIASVIGAHKGKSKKAIVFDLDNTLWGGVVGDDGITGIRCGNGNAEGEAFLAIQQYAEGLRARGVILAVCSKNDEQIAREVFQKHPEMVLRLEHISCFIANWEDKATNLHRIAAQLNIGLDSMVFVDDNPAERALVRQMAPEVAVPDLPEDPAGYIQAIERHCYFQTVSIATEDMERAEMYEGNVLRERAQLTSANLDDFLRSLDMRAMVEAVSHANVERVAQLTARSNQFNLTTRRHSATDFLRMMRSSDWLTLTVSLNDRFGNNGLISVLLARISGDSLIVDTWLMSCRVLKRGVEQLILNRLCVLARTRGVESILGEYIPTARNALVRDHYHNLGFEAVSDDGGHTWWRLSLAAQHPLETFIRTESQAHEQAD
jgi:FkbH-like protein